MTAWRTNGSFKRRLRSLTRNRHKTEVVELKNLRGNAIRPQFFLESSHDFLAILALLHVDEVHDDDATKIPQSDLPNNFMNRIDIGSCDGVLKTIGFPNIHSGIDVDRDE